MNSALPRKQSFKRTEIVSSSVQPQAEAKISNFVIKISRSPLPSKIGILWGSLLFETMYWQLVSLKFERGTDSEQAIFELGFG